MCLVVAWEWMGFLWRGVVKTAFELYSLYKLTPKNYTICKGSVLLLFATLLCVWVLCSRFIPVCVVQIAEALEVLAKFRPFCRWFGYFNYTKWILCIIAWYIIDFCLLFSPYTTPPLFFGSGQGNVTPLKTHQIFTKPLQNSLKKRKTSENVTFFYS